jgi:hypothetical protein
MPNLGFVKPIFSQSTSPSRVDVWWYDTVNHVFKYFHTTKLMWVPIKNLQIDGSFIEVYDDWFLPSRDELKAMYDELKVYGVGNFDTSGVEYWSSSEDGAPFAIVMRFSTGLIFGMYTKVSELKTRACRKFVGEVGQYSLRQVGPGGGLIFHINGTTYYEAAPSDNIRNRWSNVEVLIGTTGTAIGTGQSNTNAIVGQIGHTTSAAKLCNDLQVNVLNITKNKLTSTIGLTPEQAGAGFKISIKCSTSNKILLVESDGSDWFYITKNLGA